MAPGQVSGSFITDDGCPFRMACSYRSDTTSVRSAICLLFVKCRRNWQSRCLSRFEEMVSMRMIAKAGSLIVLLAFHGLSQSYSETADASA